MPSDPTTVSKTTCVVPFSRIYRTFIENGDDGDWEKIALFHAGFVTGQAEKVYLGACEGAMFRCPPKLYDKCLESVRFIAQQYGLSVRENTPESEIWILSNPHGDVLFSMLMDKVRNSSAWHQLRGQICGLPIRQTDYLFHQRPGYGQFAGKEEAN